VQSGCKEEFISVVDERRVEFRHDNLPGYELGNSGIEMSQIFGIGSCRIMARKELRCKKKASYFLYCRFTIYSIVFNKSNK
jgi:hypothetical protein